MRYFEADVLKVEEVSRWLRIPRSAIYKLFLDGQIPGTTIGKYKGFDQKDFRKWFKKNEKQETN